MQSLPLPETKVSDCRCLTFKYLEKSYELKICAFSEEPMVWEVCDLVASEGDTSYMKK